MCDSNFVPPKHVSSRQIKVSKNKVVETIGCCLVYCTLGVEVCDKIPRNIFVPSTLLEYHLCLQQKNLIDCGLFTAGVILHLLGGNKVNNDLFSFSLRLQ